MIELEERPRLGKENYFTIRASPAFQRRRNATEPALWGMLLAWKNCSIVVAGRLNLAQIPPHAF